MHILSDHLPNDRERFLGCFPGRQGCIRDIADKLRDVMIDLLLGPYLAFGNGDVDGIRVMHRSGPLPDDV